ncbi:MAG TPA: CheR family methyltransferase [Thermoguttaceae bacterium]|nr:CheR family methyltransferase [Thermoguttaceae bacterium]
MAFTCFFRDGQAPDLLAEHVIPDLATRRYMDVWDAGCATGPEPYSIAMTFREHMGPFLFRNLRIWATDIDETDTFGRIIARGVYCEQETKRIPAEIRARHFSPSGGDGRRREIGGRARSLSTLPVRSRKKGRPREVHRSPALEGFLLE